MKPENESKPCQRQPESKAQYSEPFTLIWTTIVSNFGRVIFYRSDSVI